MEETAKKEKRRMRGLLSWLYLLAAAVALVMTVKTCCPAFYQKAEKTLGLDENGRTAQACSGLTQRRGEGEFKEAFSQSYRVLRGDEA